MGPAQVGVLVNQVRTLEGVTSPLRPEWRARVNPGKRGQEWTLKEVGTAQAKLGGEEKHDRMGSLGRDP